MSKITEAKTAEIKTEKIGSFFQENLKLTGKRWDDISPAEKRMREKRWPNGNIWFKIPVNDKAEAELLPMHTGARNSDGDGVTQKITTRGEKEWLCYYLHTGPEVSPEVHLVGMPTRDRIYLMGESGCATSSSVTLCEVCNELFANSEVGIMSFPLDATDYKAMNVSERRVIGSITPWLDTTYTQKNKNMTVRGRDIADRGNIIECALWTKKFDEDKNEKIIEIAEHHEIWPEFIIPFKTSLVHVEYGDDCKGTWEHPYKIILPDIIEKRTSDHKA